MAPLSRGDAMGRVGARSRLRSLRLLCFETCLKIPYLLTQSLQLRFAGQIHSVQQALKRCVPALLGPHACLHHVHESAHDAGILQGLANGGILQQAHGSG